MKPRYARQLKKGAMEILVLKLLEKEKKYGYQLISELKDRSEGMFALQEGTLYPILYRLEDDGLVVSNWTQPKGKELSRKYYSITALGKNTLKELQSLWDDFGNRVSKILEDEC